MPLHHGTKQLEAVVDITPSKRNEKLAQKNPKIDRNLNQRQTLITYKIKIFYSL